jgi:hypothetical protein
VASIAVNVLDHDSYRNPKYETAQHLLGVLAKRLAEFWGVDLCESDLGFRLARPVDRDGVPVVDADNPANDI